MDLDLHEPAAQPRSRILHQLRLLEVGGYERIGGADLAGAGDLARVWERWRFVWSPDFAARCIENARYGPTLAEAAAARLAERAAGAERDAMKAALLLLDAALAGLADLAAALMRRLSELVRGDGDFFSVAGSLAHLLYLYRYDAVLETAGRGDVGLLLLETYQRTLWLLETLGQVAGRDKDLLAGTAALRDAFERCETPLELDREEIVQVLGRVGRIGGRRRCARGRARCAVVAGGGRRRPGAGRAASLRASPTSSAIS